MATARCYTKSGSVEKYESNLWSMDSVGVVVIITGPDSSGNYTVTPPSGYKDSSTPTEFYCTTIYGGVKKTFYFKESIKEIVLFASVELQVKNLLLVYLRFNNNEYLGNDKLEVIVEITADNLAAFIDSVFFTIDKNSKRTLIEKLYIEKYIYMNRTYTAKIDSCYPMEGKNYKVIIRN